MPLPATSPRAVASLGHGGGRVVVSVADLAKVGPHGYIHGWLKVGVKPDEIPVKSSDDIKTIGDLHSFAAMVPAASSDGKVEFFTHAVRSDASIDSIIHDGINPDNSGNVYLSKPPMVRDLGAGYVVAQHPAGKARASTDVVSATERYPEYKVDGVHPDDVVKVVREVPYDEGGHSIREDDLAAYAASHQGLDDEDVRSLPAKYQAWFHFGTAAGITKNAADLHDPTRIDAEHVFQNLLANYPPKAIAWVKTMPWVGPVNIPLDRIDWDAQDSWAASHQTKRVKKFQKKIRSSEKDVNPVTLVQVPGNDKCVIIDGHHRALAYKNEGKPIKAYVGMADSDEPGSPWFKTHDFQYAHGSNPANKMFTVTGNTAVKHDILGTVTELSLESGVVKAALFPTLWEFAVAPVIPDVEKVGKEGYIHGWICVRPPCGKVGDAVTHDDHGNGKIIGVSGKKLTAHFEDGADGILGDRRSPLKNADGTWIHDNHKLEAATTGKRAGAVRVHDRMLYAETVHHPTGFGFTYDLRPHEVMAIHSQWVRKPGKKPVKYLTFSLRDDNTGQEREEELKAGSSVKIFPREDVKANNVAPRLPRVVKEPKPKPAPPAPKPLALKPLASKPLALAPSPQYVNAQPASLDKPLTGKELWMSGEGVAPPVTDWHQASLIQAVYYSNFFSYTNNYLRDGTLPSKSAIQAGKDWDAQGFLGGKLRMRMVPPVDTDAKWIEGINTIKNLVASAAPFSRPAILYRDVTNPDQVFGPVGSLKGRTFSDPGFMSTTAFPDSAERYGGKGRIDPKTGHEPVGDKIILRIPTGGGGMRTQSTFSSDHAREREFTFAPGTRWRVDDDQLVSGKRQTTLTQIVPPGTKPGPKPKPIVPEIRAKERWEGAGVGQKINVETGEYVT